MRNYDLRLVAISFALCSVVVALIVVTAIAIILALAIPSVMAFTTGLLIGTLYGIWARSGAPPFNGRS